MSGLDARVGLAHAAGVTLSVIDGSSTQGRCFRGNRTARRRRWCPYPDPDYQPAVLEDGQAEAADALWATVAKSGDFGVTLLDGVTGSGKTEVYFEAIAEAVRGTAGSDPAAGDLADGPFLDRFHRAFRGAAGGMAFGAGAEDAREGVAAGDRGPCQRGSRRRAFGAVPAVRMISG
jgi:hypothetical protein